MLFARKNVKMSFTCHISGDIAMFMNINFNMVTVHFNDIFMLVFTLYKYFLPFFTVVNENIWHNLRFISEDKTG